MANPRSPELRIQRIEEQLAHEQHTVQQLNDVITNLHLDFKRLSEKFDKLQTRLTELATKQDAGPMPDEKPPHY